MRNSTTVVAVAKNKTRLDIDKLLEGIAIRHATRQARVKLPQLNLPDRSLCFCGEHHCNDVEMSFRGNLID